jgi:hypothetical protein
MMTSLRSKWAVDKARGGRIPHHFTLLQIWFSLAGIKMVRDVTDEQRSRRPIFQRNPPGRGQLAVFPRCSLARMNSDMGASLAP